MKKFSANNLQSLFRKIDNFFLENKSFECTNIVILKKEVYLFTATIHYIELY